MRRTPNSQRKFAKTNELLKNPYIGFTSFQHFRDEPLFSDCATTDGWIKEHYPVHDFVEQNGRSQGFYPDTEIAYIRMLWKDFEKEEGVYDFSITDEVFRKAAEKNQTVMFRLMPHTTRENEDVPEWLRKIIDCPARPATARVKDSPENPLFIENFAKAIEAFGEKYDGAENFYAMDISLTGAWGEGYGFRNYPEEILKNLVDTYTSSFKKTHLLGQICSPELVNYANETRPVGFRADGLGEDFHMNDYFPKNIFRMKDVWKKAPVSFESFWYLTEWKKQGWDIDEIIEQTLKWHISSLNGKSSSVPFEWKDKVDAWLRKMGYRFSIRLFEYPSSAAPGDNLMLTLWVENSGVAPIYSALPFSIRFKKDNFVTEFTTDIDVRNWLPGDSIEHPEITLPENLASGTYDVECKLGEGKLSTVKFAMDTPHTEDGYYHLAKIDIE